jgi:hypothetical protein
VLPKFQDHSVVHDGGGGGRYLVELVLDSSTDAALAIGLKTGRLQKS